MQYARIFVKATTTKREETFVYGIPAEILPQIKVGQLVKVPFNKKKVLGVVAKIVRRPPRELGRAKIKKIEKIISLQPVVSQRQFEIAEFLSREYLTSYSRSLFRIIPQFPTRGLEHFHKIQKVKGNHRRFTLALGSPKQRMRAYLRVALKAKKQTLQTIVVFPTRDLAEYFSSFLAPEISSTILPWVGGVKEKAINWLHIESGQFEVVTGTRSALFAPLQKLGLLIIDDPDHPAHKDQRMPKFHSFALANYFHTRAHAQVVLGASLKPFPLLGKKVDTINLQTKFPKIQVVTSDKAPESLLEGYLQGSSDLVVMPSLSHKQILYCPDCKDVARCPDCREVLRVNSQICPVCAYQFSSFSLCPDCSGAKVTLLSSNFEKIRRHLRQVFPDSPIWEISAKTAPPIGADLEGISLATEKIITYPSSFERSVIINPEFLGGGNNISGSYRFVRLILAVRAITRQKLTIISNLSNAREISQALNKPNHWLKKFLRERKALSLPPFARLIKATIEETNVEKLASKRTKLEQDFKKNALSFFWLDEFRTKGGFKQSVIIKTKKKFLPTTWFSELQSLNFKTIDVDPISLS